MNKDKHIPSGYKSSPLGIIPEDWEVKRLGEVCTHFKSGITITSKDIHEEGLYPVYGGNGLRGYTNTFTHDGNYILIGRQGALCGNINYVDGKNYISEHAIAVQTDENMQWLKYKLENWNLNRFSESSAQPGLSVEKLVRYKLVIPTRLEQNKIADILSLWDTAIAKQTALIEKLILRKRGLMQQLLTGKKRLKGFEGEWKEVRLGEVCDLTKGEQVNSETLTETGLFPVINGGITPSGYKDDYNTEANTITISEGGNSCGFVNLIKTKFWSSGHCYTISNIINFDLIYLYYSLKFAEPHIMNLRVGSGLPNIQLGSLQKFTLLMPQLEEQKAIAAIIGQTDKEIEIQKQKLAAMQEQKKGLMHVLLTGKKRIKII